VEVLRLRARLADPHTVELSDGARVTARHVLVAVGGQPSVPPVENADLGIVSDDVFHLERMPERLMIVGGGYIGCEFAGVFNGLGAQVTMFIRNTQILRGFDDEARGHVADGLRARGVDIHTECTPERIERLGNGRLRVTGATGAVAEVDTILWATGRVPSTAGLGLEEAGVELGEKGEVVVDEYFQTAVPSVYALGDCIGRLELTPVAIREGVAFHKTVFGGEPTAMDYENVPRATFTQPEMGSVGMTEEEAAETGRCEVYTSRFRPLLTVFAGGEERTLFKMLVAKGSRRVLGVHVVGPYAAEMIQMAAVAVKMGATKEDFDRTCALHPTLAEEMMTLREPSREVG
jgi:glutathione reductase (NADPH)